MMLGNRLGRSRSGSECIMIVMIILFRSFLITRHGLHSPTLPPITCMYASYLDSV